VGQRATGAAHTFRRRLDLDSVLPGISAKSASDLRWIRLPLKLIELPALPNGLTMHGVLESFDHGLEVPEAVLEALETLRYRRIPPAGLGRGAR
jgi:hypothetical protein